MHLPDIHMNPASHSVWVCVLLSPQQSAIPLPNFAFVQYHQACKDLNWARQQIREEPYSQYLKQADCLRDAENAWIHLNLIHQVSGPLPPLPCHMHPPWRPAASPLKWAQCCAEERGAHGMAEIFLHTNPPQQTQSEELLMLQDDLARAEVH